MAVTDLITIFERTGDFCLKREILQALHRIGTEEAMDMIRRVARSDTVVVQKAVELLLSD